MRPEPGCGKPCLCWNLTMPPADWAATTWGELATLEYGRPHPAGDHRTSTGPNRVYGSNGPIGWTSESIAAGPGVIVGRKGAYRGVEYTSTPFWVIDTGFWLRP